MSEGARDGGFGLIEAIVALLLVAMAATTLFDLITGTVSRRASAQARWEELVSAQAMLKRELASPLEGPGWHRLVGEDRMAWWIRSAPWPETPRLRRIVVARQQGGPAVAATLYLVEHTP
jgi:hypothetical protein